MTETDLVAISPLIFVIALAMLIIVADIIWPDRDDISTGLTVAGLLVGAGLTVLVAQSEAREIFAGAYVVDPLTSFLDVLFLAIALVTVLVAPDYLRPRGLPMAEFTATLLFAISGAMLISGSRDLLVLFLGLELLVLPGYMLAGYAKRDGYSTEGAIKYFLLGSFSSAIFLFGLALTWGFTGTTRIREVAASLAQLDTASALAPALLMGLALLTTGVAFKIAAVPFHYWTPDAYQGSPTPVTGYLSVGPKVAAFALILRLFVEALAPIKADWTPVVIVLAAITMTLGNLVALTQDNVKRMLAYSSIAHTGYIMVGLAAYAGAPVGSEAERAGLEGLLFYSVAYAFMNLGAFAIVSALQHRRGVTSQIETFAGLGRRAPWAAILMTLFLLSLTGIPPTAGFFAKAYVVLAAVQAGGWVSVLAVIAVLNAAAAAFYYLRVVVFMFMRDPPETARPVLTGTMMRAGLAITAVMTIFIGLVPPVTSGVIEFARVAAEVLLVRTAGG
ncbi:MAG: NADH-quinone oxidoreductase subunit N [Chloroflexi bacterium]|nr:NADH-quinone oxidoreductase subunit N [Chloroflexota bacterium]